MDQHKKFSVVNPSKMCQPMGAIQAILGVNDTMPLIHGSQGCSTYIRFQLTRHFREPVEVASTSMHEKTVIYGGEYNLMKALKNITEKQSPNMIVVTSSCLTETIGEDMHGIIERFKESNPDKKLPIIIPVSTPSYVESHVEGYNRTIKALVEYLAVKSVPNRKINIVLGNISPADVKNIKEILDELKCGHILLTDNSENLDAPLSESTLNLYDNGTSIEDIQDTANSSGTISISKHVDSAGIFLEKKYGVKSISGPIPVGLDNTDAFINSICGLENLTISESIERERGRLIDAMVDAHSYNYRRKVAIFGDPDFVSGITRFTSEMGMIPSVVCSGTSSKRFSEEINIISQEKDINPIVLSGGDLYDMHRAIKQVGVDILIGNSYGASMAKEENIPLLRTGFPIFDRLGAQRISSMGYKGGINFVDRLTNTLLDFYYDEAGYEMPVDDEKTIENELFVKEDV